MSFPGMSLAIGRDLPDQVAQNAGAKNESERREQGGYRAGTTQAVI